MRRTTAEVEAQVKEFGRARFEVVQNITFADPYDFGAALILAIGIRETNLQNIAGNHGHGRGIFQHDDRFHSSWLKSIVGCNSGSYLAVYGVVAGGAAPGGRVPTLVDAVQRTVKLLQGNLEFAATNGVHEKHRKRFAIAAYNCGAGNALKSYHEGGIDNIDARTANHNYSEDVRETRPLVTQALTKLHWS